MHMASHDTTLFDPKEIFGRQVAHYQKGRVMLETPEVGRWLAHMKVPPDSAVADVAAGTGNLTVPLAKLGYQVTAIEPNDAMRGALADRLQVEGITTVAIKPGTAEKLPLEDQSVHLIGVANALHWFDPAKAKPEMRRALAPSGWLLGLSSIISPDAEITQKLHAVLTKECPDYSEAPTQFASTRQSHVDRYIEAYITPSFYEKNQPVIHFSFERFIAYLASISSLADWMSGPTSRDAALASMERFFHQHEEDGEIPLTWDMVVAAGEL
ncbi:methyltransferase domain-containing protein [bacterium]|nr:methyltransferase domain-containing protein [bacterium]